MKHSTAQDENKRQARQEDIRQAHRDYLARAEALTDRLRATHGQLAHPPAVPLRLPSWMVTWPTPSGQSTESAAAC